MQSIKRGHFAPTQFMSCTAIDYVRSVRSNDSDGKAGQQLIFESCVHVMSVISIWVLSIDHQPRDIKKYIIAEC